MDIKVLESSLRDFLKTNATTEEIIKSLSLCGPTVDRFHKTKDDTLFEIESITNRIDTASVFGVARDAHAILSQMGFKSKLENSPYEFTLPNHQNLPKVINISINCPEQIIRFTAATFSQCQTKISPQKTQDLLNSSDQRPINNLIDITNELTLLFGLPTHVFDLDKLSMNQLIIRLAKAGESLKTLDNQTIVLANNDIIIEDGSGKLVDLCGIMGGQVAEVDDHTKNILFIAPIYHPKNIRQTSLRVQKRTLAAQIYEKSPDPELTPHILSIASKLIRERTGGKLSSQVFDYYPNPLQSNKIEINQNWLNNFAGIDIPTSTTKSILSNLGFKDIQSNETSISCLTPSFRTKDINLPEDLAEEILRVYGYYQIPGTLPAITTPPETPNPLFTLEKKLRDTLSSLQYFEIYNNSLVSKTDLEKYNLSQNEPLKLQNALSEDFEYLRPDLTISTLKNHQSNQGKTDLPKKFFEIANTYHQTKDQELPLETSTLCISSEKDIFSLKSDLEKVFSKLNQNNYSFIKNSDLGADITNNNQLVGTICQIDPKVQNNFYLKNTISVIEINLVKLVTSLDRTKHFQPISEYPDVKFDININSKLPIGEIIKKIKEVDPLIAEIKYIESYNHKHTFQITLRSYTQNLTKDSIPPIQQSLSSLF